MFFNSFLRHSPRHVPEGNLVYIYIASTKRYQAHIDIRGILMHVASGLFSWSMAKGPLAFSSRHFAPTINVRFT